MKEKETPRVLISGAGPTGLMLAGQLALRDVPFRIIDKNEDHTTQSRALVVQARSVEIFGQMDIAQEALDLGEKAKAVNVVVNGKRVLHMNVRDIGEGLTPYPYLLMLEQSKTEKILNDFLAHRGHTVERQTELLDFTQDAHSVGTQDMVKGTQFHFVLFSGEETNEEAQQILQKLKEVYPDRIEFHEIRLFADTKELYEKFGMKKQGYYFVRPDSHIAYRSASLNTQNFSRYLERFLMRGSAT